MEKRNAEERGWADWFRIGQLTDSGRSQGHGRCLANISNFLTPVQDEVGIRLGLVANNHVSQRSDGNPRDLEILS